MLKIIRKLDKIKIRGLCIEKRLYTEGSNDDYCKMFSKCSDAKTDTDVIDIALDIVSHSEANNVEEIGGLEELIYELSTACTRIMVVEDPWEDVD